MLDCLEQTIYIFSTKQIVNPRGPVPGVDRKVRGKITGSLLFCPHSIYKGKLWLNLDY
jgi:hypothetical protein